LGDSRLSKEIEDRDQDTSNGDRPNSPTLKATEGGPEMSDNLELLRGSGNVFSDFGCPNAGLEQARAILAAEIIRTLDARDLSTRDAEKLTGVGHSEFSRIRNAKLDRFTLDRMIAILGKLDENVEVSITFHPRRYETHDRPNIR
jgi:predicted XRE-type DNA-binding protein